VSIIIPTYNGEKFLRDALQSVITQSYPHWELLVIDNGSTDLTKEIVMSFPRAQYFFLENRNVNSARNTGVQHSRGEYIAFLDHDDMWNIEKLTKQVAFLEENDEYMAAVCHQQMYLQPGYSKPHWLKEAFLQRAMPAYLPSALLMRKSALNSSDFFDESLLHTSDVEWFFRVKDQGLKVKLLEETLVERRIHEDNASNNVQNLQKELLIIIKNSLNFRRNIHAC